MEKYRNRRIFLDKLTMEPIVTPIEQATPLPPPLRRQPVKKPENVRNGASGERGRTQLPAIGGTGRRARPGDRDWRNHGLAHMALWQRRDCVQSDHQRALVVGRSDARFASCASG